MLYEVRVNLTEIKTVARGGNMRKAYDILEGKKKARAVNTSSTKLLRFDFNLGTYQELN